METRKKKVLVVEDDPNVLKIASTILRGRGYEVAEASDGQKALDAVDYCDVVLLDLMLPNISGEEFLKRIRKAGNYIPVVVMSAGYSKEEGTQKLKDYGIVDFIAKPFSAQQISEKLSKAFVVAEDMKFVGTATESLKGFIERQTRI